MNRVTPDILTPAKLEFLLYTYYCPSIHPRVQCKTFQEAIEYFVEHEIMEHRSRPESGLAVTEKGKAWIEHMLETPMPVQKWVRGE